MKIEHGQNDRGWFNNGIFVQVVISLDEVCRVRTSRIMDKNIELATVDFRDVLGCPLDQRSSARVQVIVTEDLVKANL